MAALRKLGVRCALGFSAVGSLKEEVKPRDFVLVDQLVDWTKGVSLETSHQSCHTTAAEIQPMLYMTFKFGMKRVMEAFQRMQR